MKRITKVVVGVLLGFGLPITLLGTIELLNPQNSPSEKEEAIPALVLFGLTPTGLGGWMLWQNHQRNLQAKNVQLQAAFFQLLKETDGHITPIRLAMATGLNGQAAKAYLDERAKEFEAVYNISEEGNISYFFDLGGADST